MFFTALLLTGCGYHLRGNYALPAELKKVYLAGGTAQLHEQFKQIMKSSSGQLLSSSEGAGIVVKIANEDFRRRALSLSSRGKSNEFELLYHVEYELANAKNTTLTERLPLEIKREYFNDQQDIMAKDNEEVVIRKEMYEQAVRAIINRARVVLEAKAK
jgi:LPS-assembly lipoprotein